MRRKYAHIKGAGSSSMKCLISNEKFSSTEREEEKRGSERERERRERERESTSNNLRYNQAKCHCAVGTVLLY